MPHGERRDHPEAVSPIAPLINRGEGEQEQDMVERLGVDDMAEAEMDEAQEVAHDSSLRSRERSKNRAGLSRLERVPVGIDGQRLPQVFGCLCPVTSCE